MRLRGSLWNFRERARPDAAGAIGCDVVGADALLDRGKPRVVNPLCDVALSDVHEHHDRAEQQP